MEYYLAVKRNEAFMYATRVIIRSLISQSQEIKYCVVLLTSTTCTSKFTDPESTAKHWGLGKKMNPCLTGVKFQFGARMVLGVYLTPLSQTFICGQNGKFYVAPFRHCENGKETFFRTLGASQLYPSRVLR